MIYTITLNPAIDQILYLKEYEPEITNRLTGTKACLGGKGTHVSQNLKLLGIDNVAMGIVHGETGAKIIEMLKEDGIDTQFQLLPGGDTRTNYLVIEESGSSTCLAARGVQLTDEDIQNFVQLLREKLKDDDYLVISGDASNCPDPYVYNKILDALKDVKLNVFLDASGETLKKCVSAKPYMIKPNQDELGYLTGMPVETEEEIKKAVESLDQYNIPVVAVSLGGRGSLIHMNDTFYRVYPPKVNVFNTIGCGDCFLSGLIYGVYRGLDADETIRVATAASAATAESSLSVGFDMERFEELKALVKIEKF